MGLCGSLSDRWGKDLEEKELEEEAEERRMVSMAQELKDWGTDVPSQPPAISALPGSQDRSETGKYVVFPALRPFLVAVPAPVFQNKALLVHRQGPNNLGISVALVCRALGQMDLQIPPVHVGCLII
ncbi:Phospholipid-Transporting Atpase Id [Manis pentadactyla]|nr:Phospholipid-Transporting Atpase Id [Manis pentadactyla]